MATIRAISGDCLRIMDELPRAAFDLVYLDPPFFTQEEHRLTTRDGSATFRFHDVWTSHDEYADFLYQRLVKCRSALSNTGSLFFHCDRNASHIARLVLDKVFGAGMFRAEIIWTYRRWSNACKGLLPAHQNILFYSKSNAFKFHQHLTDYSGATNLDQIVQKRTRDKRGKAVYARDDRGEIISNGPKRGVPLSDVWDIPYLNPKAKERVGYPTQKPMLLLERIIRLCTDAGDWILDPFCGSGTTLVAAKLLDRNAIGIDLSEAAIAVTNDRLENGVRTESALLQKGRTEYLRADADLLQYLKGVDHFVVQRNQGIDAVLKQEYHGKPVFVRVQRRDETVADAASALYKATRGKGPSVLIVVVVNDGGLGLSLDFPETIHFVRCTSAAIKAVLEAVEVGIMGAGIGSHVP